MALDSKYVPSSSTRLPCAWILHRTVTALDKGDAGFFWRLLGSGSSRLLVLGKWLLASDPSGHLQHVRLDQENEGHWSWGIGFQSKGNKSSDPVGIILVVAWDGYWSPPWTRSGLKWSLGQVPFPVGPQTHLIVVYVIPEHVIGIGNWKIPASFPWLMEWWLLW